MLVSCETFEGLKPLGKIVGHEEGVEVRFELSVTCVVVALNGRLLQGSAHPLDLALDQARMFGALSTLL